MQFAWMLDVAQLLILGGIPLGFVRLAKGPTPPDRIVALIRRRSAWLHAVHSST
jgi:Multisubunit Na+/H+ antiporter, MnhF subunit